MELSHYNLTFVYIKDTENIHVDTISRLKTLDIYTQAPENPKTTLNTDECTGEVVANK